MESWILKEKAVSRRIAADAVGLPSDQDPQIVGFAGGFGQGRAMKRE